MGVFENLGVSSGVVVIIPQATGVGIKYIPLAETLDAVRDPAKLRPFNASMTDRAYIKTFSESAHTPGFWGRPVEHTPINVYRIGLIPK
jgi:hypothetical protein